MYRFQIYNKKFYKNNVEGAINSALAFADFINTYLRPNSVVDVGCALGLFLSELEKSGIKQIIGIDGEWVNKNRLFINPDNFISADIRNPININRKFDLAICLDGVHHVNCRWQSYWAKKFQKRGYSLIDIRRVIWGNKKIADLYKQKTMLYVKTGLLHKYSSLIKEVEKGIIIDMVHLHSYSHFKDPETTPS